MQHSIKHEPPSIRFEWDIADGYYLYKNQLSFQALNPTIRLDTNAIQYPSSEQKQDPDFGNVPVYRNRLVLDIPFIYTPHKTVTEPPEIKVTYQGCADQGLCYTPQHKKITLTALNIPNAKVGVSAQEVTNSHNSPPGIQPLLNTNVPTIHTANKNPTPAIEPLLNDNINPQNISSDDFLPLSDITNKQTPSSLGLPKTPEKELVQFQSSLTPEGTQLKIEGIIEPNYYLPSDSLSFQLLIPEETPLKKPQFSKGKQVEDEFFGLVEIYEKNFQSLLDIENIQSPYITLVAQYTVCSRLAATCENALQSELSIDINTLETATINKSSGFSVNTDLFFYGDVYQTLLLFFAIGLGLSFTPCIFPMIPILSSLIIGQTHLSIRKGFLLSFTYVLFSAIAYALIGIAFGFFGNNLQASLQNPVVISLLAGLFVLLALSMFGFFELQAPHTLQNRLTNLSNRQRSGSLIGAAIMGFLSTLIVGPCIAPPLAAALTYIADSKDAFLGGMTLFSMGLGLGIPLLIAGTSAGHLLPRAGEWMDTTKVLSGLVMLAMAIWMLDRIIPIEITMLLSGILMLAAGIHMGALDKLLPESGGWDRFWKSIGFSLMLYGSLVLLGVAIGSQNLFQPLKGIFDLGHKETTTIHEASNTYFQPIKSTQDLQRILTTAGQQGRYVMLDFYADWCIDCKRMHRNVFSSSNVQQALNNIITLKADVTKNDLEDQQLMRSLNVIGPPTLIFFDKTGRAIEPLTAIGYQNKQKFLSTLEQLKNY